MDRKKIATLTLGCKVNSYDTQAMLELFINKGYDVEDFSNFADVYLINTCTVTNLGDKKSRQMIRRAKKQNPNAIIVAAGCYAQVSPDEVSKVEGINLIIGTKDRNNIVDLLEDYELSQGVLNAVTDINQESEFENLEINSLSSRTRAFVKIQEGCNEFCSYCIIPYARGRVRSRKPEDVLSEVNRLVENGFKEIVIGGINVASYGKDTGNINLLGLLKQIHEVEGLKRIRFSSIEPNVVTEEFVECIKNLEKVCDFFHLSLQSGCDKILKSMNRKYNTNEYREAVNRLRLTMPNVGISTDIIVGFPGESEEDFLESLNFAEEMEFSKIHIFPYSAKKGTKASTFQNQVDSDIKQKRANEMKKIDVKAQENFLKKYLNKELDVLYEKKVESKIYEGYSTNYIKVHSYSEKCVENKILKVEINGIQDFFCISDKIHL